MVSHLDLNMSNSFGGILKVADVYEYVEQRNLKDKNFKHNVSLLYKNNARWIFPFYDIIAKVLFFWLRPKTGKKYFFLGTRFVHLIAALPKNEVCIIGGPRQLLFCLKNNISYVPNGNFWKVLSVGFNSAFEKKLSFLAYKMSDTLASLADRSAQAIIIIENDSLPLQRTFCNISKKANIKTVCIQHGLFQSKTDARTIDGWVCDYFICYDTNQKNVITGLGVNDDKLIIGGFYEPISKNIALPCSYPIKICFFGQPWFKYGDVYKEKYLGILDKISAEFLKKGIKYNFKPHPWESDAPYLKTMDNVFNGSMRDAIREHDVFISLTSTALLEVTMSGKIAVQIYDSQFVCDNFEELGYAYSILSEDIEGTLSKILKYPPYKLQMPDFTNLVYQIKKLAKVNM